MRMVEDLPTSDRLITWLYELDEFIDLCHIYLSGGKEHGISKIEALRVSADGVIASLVAEAAKLFGHLDHMLAMAARAGAGAAFTSTMPSSMAIICAARHSSSWSDQAMSARAARPRTIFSR
ncbi:hypothetical protein EOA13_29510 [Mesorhizobium sp. M7A.F.Ca.US.011.01.1.1]|uniref:hypothetical protein n=1 Tax=Mesorhizobium sp. M7A.F.Ca.US.011.01.1.1 TaxID=2496741 RepID=UPI000FCB5718|nr:hypothetical protein [Mesorhizobium sp. M7A.F.Ca.US.011.01.1.1]RUX24788.1 hypothetical protein EOA13_29510 [Mesorhizobium sp. M7A.F.Ca.US.011.01.1.1]